MSLGSAFQAGAFVFCENMARKKLCVSGHIRSDRVDVFHHSLFLKGRDGGED